VDRRSVDGVNGSRRAAGPVVPAPVLFDGARLIVGVGSGAVHTDILPFSRELSSRRQPSHVDAPPASPRGLSGVNELRMISRMTTSRRPQQRYDHRLRVLVHNTGT
jgi:hypothetical protein